MRLFNVTPRLAKDDFADVRLGDTKTSGNRALTDRARKQSHRPHVICGDASEETALAIRRRRYGFEVLRIHAQMHATQMVEVKPFRDPATVTLIDDPMRADESLAIPVQTVACRIANAEPQPTPGIGINSIALRRPLAAPTIVLSYMARAASPRLAINELSTINAEGSDRLRAHSVILTLDATPGGVSAPPGLSLPILPYLGRGVASFA
jgi:hypothetical protein